MTEQSDTHSRNLIVVDAHVHFHPMWRADDFLSSAVSNLGRSAEAMTDGVISCFVLAVVDATDQTGFDRLRDNILGLRNRQSDGRTWRLRATRETTSICLERGGLTVVVLKGRQIRTAENLEVLSIGTEAAFEDGLPIRHALESAAAAGAIPVIPWGFGKWFGRRGQILGDLLDASDPADFFLGDNSNRPAGAPRSGLFTRADGRGFRILPGSDPLPFAGEFQSVGRAGFILPGRLDLNHPSGDLKRLLTKDATAIQPFVELESPLRFVRNQLLMQWTKHVRRTGK